MKILESIATQEVDGTKIGVDISSLQQQAYQLQQVTPLQDNMMLGLESSFLAVVVLLILTMLHFVIWRKIRICCRKEQKSARTGLMTVGQMAKVKESKSQDTQAREAAASPQEECSEINIYYNRQSLESDKENIKKRFLFHVLL